ncbi:MAG: DNA replication and repair protein RecF [Tenericutes bacterium]|nr:DNA replication and repair protein RecF [Mycoplasmatota bacterium]
MHIRKIELTNFRNYDKFKIDNLEDINVIIGANGIGKTSIIESIYVASTARSFKNNDENVMIKSNSDYFKIKVLVDDEIRTKQLEYLLTNNGKKTKINSRLKKKISDYIFQYKVVLFSPDELKIIKESPTVRRNYLNVNLSQINKTYIKLLNTYNVLIKNKNEYLKKLYINGNLDERYLDILDLKIAEIGSQICLIRKEYIDKINKKIKRIFKKFKKDDEVYVDYQSQFLNKSNDEILMNLKKNRIYEETIGFTKTGIHRDDFVFLHNGKNAKEYSSQGLQKLILLSFKMAELEVLIDDYYEEPILLLDDLFSELDIINQNSIINNLNTKIQVFVTTTDINNVKPNLLKKAKIIDLNERSM